MKRYTTNLPNILLIVLDCVRADHLSCYGYGRETSPNIDRIAEQGVIYNQAISPSPWTLPSHASLFTGTYVSRHRTDLDNRYLDRSFITLAEVLKQRGYNTVGLSSNAWVSRETGLDRGFDLYYNMNRPPYESGRKLKAYQKCANYIYWNYLYKRYDYGARNINNLLRKFFKSYSRQSPFFIFINYLEAHLKYEPPRKFRHSFLRKSEDKYVPQDAWAYLVGAVGMTEEDFYILKALYDAEIRYMDFRVGEIIELLEKAGILDHTMIIITADHGENIGDHGLMDHQFSLHDSLSHVPLIIRYPDIFPRGLRIQSQVQSVDLFSTLCDILQVDDDRIEAQLQGKSLLPSLSGNKLRSYAFSEYLVPNLQHLERKFPHHDYSKYNASYRTIRTENFKLIYTIPNGSYQLYNLQDDPMEEKDVSKIYTEVTGEFLTSLTEWTSQVSSYQGKRNIQLDDDTIIMLKSLGYM